MHYHAILRVGGRVLGLALGLATFSAHADYRSTILNDQPVVYLRLGESSGLTAVSETNSAYNGTYTSAGNVTFGIAGALSNVINILFSCCVICICWCRKIDNCVAGHV